MQVIPYKDVSEAAVTRTDVIGEQYNRHLLGAVATGTDAVVADLVRFPDGFVHKLHRHPAADQVMFVLSGSIIAFDDSSSQELGPETAAVFGKGEWHGARVVGAGAVVLNLFCGIGDLAEAGYEEHPEAERLSRPR